MPIPIIPIVAVLGAGTLGYFIGRETASCPASAGCRGDADEDEHEDEETRTASQALGSGGEAPGDEEEAKNGAFSVASPAGGDEAAEREEGTNAAWKNMTRAEALEVLELAPDATPDAIREAHRRIMQRIHPDQGGFALPGRRGRPCDGRAAGVACSHALYRPRGMCPWPAWTWRRAEVWMHESRVPLQCLRRVLPEPPRCAALRAFGPRRRRLPASGRRIQSVPNLRYAAVHLPDLRHVRTLPGPSLLAGVRGAEPAGLRRVAWSNP